jgi:hypothetical protein
VLLRRVGSDWQEVMSSGSGGTGDVRCQVRKSANQTMPNNDASVPITFDVEIADTHGMHDGTTNTDRITISAAAGAGRYLVTGTVVWNVTAAGGYRSAGLAHLVGSTYTTFAQSQNVLTAGDATSDYVHCNVVGIREAAVGDAFVLFGAHRAGADLALIGGAFGSSSGRGSDVTTTLSVVKLN